MKTTDHKISKTLDVSAEAAWEVIGAVKGVDQWLGPITSCRVEGNKRYCGTEGGEFEEDILKLDHENRVFQYAIPAQHIVPVKNILGEMKVNPAANEQALVEWSWKFEVEEQDEAQARETFNMMGNMGLEGIENFIKQGAELVS